MDTNGSGAISGPEPSAAPPLTCLRATTRSQTAAHTAISSSAAAGGRRSSFSICPAASSVGRIALSTAAAAADANAMAAIDSKLRRGPRKRALNADGEADRAGGLASGRRQRRRLSPSRSGISGTGAAQEGQAPCAWKMLSPDVIGQIMSRLMEVDLRCARLVCREWVQMAGSAVTVLRPLAFHPAALPELFPSLSQLDLSMVAKDVTPAGLASLSPLALLRALVIKKWRQTSRSGMHAVASLPALESLTLRSCERLRDIHVDALEAMAPRLLKLDLSGCVNLTDDGVAKLASLTRLRSLCLAECLALTDKGIGALAPLAGSLRELDLSYCYALRGLSLDVLPQLRLLNLHWCENVVDEGMEQVGRLQHLTSLDLSMVFNATEAGMASLLRLTALRELNLTDGLELTPGRLAQLATLHTLHSLSLRDCYELKTESLAAMAVGLSELRSLDICGCEQLHEDAAVALSALRHLTELNVGSCHQAITVRSCQALGSMPALRSLHMEDCPQLTARAIAGLTGLTNLCALDVAYSGLLTDGAMRSLTAMTALSSLNFARCGKLTGRGFSALRKLPRLTSLHIMWCNNLSLKSLLKVATLTALTELNVAGCGKVTDCALLEFGSRLPRLEHFTCSYCNRVSDRGFRALRQLPRLQTVGIVGCYNVRDPGNTRGFACYPHVKVITKAMSPA